MIYKHCCRPRLLLCAVLTIGLLSVMVLPGQSEENSAPRDQQIADLEKQIQEMNKKLAELRKSTNGAVVAPAVEGGLSHDWIKALTWRCIGPAAMGGRIIALSIFEADPSTYWVATASGGLWISEDGGRKWKTVPTPKVPPLAALPYKVLPDNINPIGLDPALLV